ncbi:MAG: glycerate kinase [Acidobacteriaceae bacterium]
MADEEDQSAHLQSLHEDARAIFAYAVDACRIERVFEERIHCERATLVLDHSSEHPALSQPSAPATRIDLGAYRKTLVIALGKAAVPMTQSLLGILPSEVRVGGICSAPARPAKRDWRIRYYAGGHPLPNRDSFRAAQHALRLLHRASEKIFVIYLISGGGSTLFDLPLDPEISLADTILFHEALIASGATIAEINTLRKHFSAVKGGRLATAAQHAEKLVLQVADVPPRHADALASGPVVPDPSTVEDCREVLARYRLLEKFPPSVRNFFNQPELPETPGDKAALKERAERVQAAREAGLTSFSFLTANTQPAGFPTQIITLLSNHELLLAAQAHAVALGYEVFVDNGCDDWPYEKAAAYLIDRFIELRGQHPRRKLCLLSGGEVTVRIDRKPGTGGRNQQFALACALLLQRLAGEAAVCLSAGSDGADGNSPAAGAIADITTVARAQALGFTPERALAAFDACPLFTALGDTLVTGPTGNNLRDLRVLVSL